MLTANGAGQGLIGVPPPARVTAVQPAVLFKNQECSDPPGGRVIAPIAGVCMKQPLGTRLPPSFHTILSIENACGAIDSVGVGAAAVANSLPNCASDMLRV